MSISLDELASEVSEPMDVNVGSEELPKIVRVRYKPGAMTPALEDRIFTTAMKSQIGSVYRMMLLETLTEWDITGTLPAIEVPAMTADENPHDYQQTHGQTIKENKGRTTPHVLAVTAESISLVPISVLERIVVAIQGAQSPKKPTSKSSAGSFGASAVAPYQRGTA